MKLLVTVVLSVVFLHAEVSARAASRIIGGGAAREGQFPFVAALEVEKADLRFFCGGALIAEDWILTAGVCASETINVTITLGSTAREDPDAVVAVPSRIIAHPDFDPDTLVNDIGLIQLSEPVELSDTIKTIKLSTINLPTILKPYVVGWGQTSGADDADLSPDLNYAELNVLTNDICRATYGNQIQDTMVCLLGDNSEGTCYGDSGNPLVVRPLGSSVIQHVGISSFFGADCESGNPSGFTRTSSYLDWIEETISSEQ